MHNEQNFCPGDYVGVVNITEMLTDNKKVWVTFKAKNMEHVNTAIWISFSWSVIFTLIHIKLAYFYREKFYWGLKKIYKKFKWSNNG